MAAPGRFKKTACGGPIGGKSARPLHAGELVGGHAYHTHKGGVPGVQFTASGYAPPFRRNMARRGLYAGPAALWMWTAILPSPTGAVTLKMLRASRTAPGSGMRTSTSAAALHLLAHCVWLMEVWQDRQHGEPALFNLKAPGNWRGNMRALPTYICGRRLRSRLMAQAERACSSEMCSPAYDTQRWSSIKEYAAGQPAPVFRTLEPDTRQPFHVHH